MAVIGTESAQHMPTESTSADVNEWMFSIFCKYSKTNQFQNFPTFVTNHTNQNLFLFVSNNQMGLVWEILVFCFLFIEDFVRLPSLDNILIT